MTAVIEPTAVDLEMIARDVWASLMLDGEVLPGGMAPEPAPDAEVVTAVVSISGAWNGHVAVHAAQEVAAGIAADMLGLDAAEIATNDLVDAIGELANVVGGNVKGMLPPPNQLSLPHVVVGPSASHHWPHVTMVCQVDVIGPAGTVVLTIWSSTLGGPRA